MKKTDGTIRVGFKRVNGEYYPVFDSIEEAMEMMTNPTTQDRVDKYTPGKTARSMKFYIGTQEYASVEEVYDDDSN